MARSLNRVQLIGNCGRDPEVRTTAGDKKVATVSLATSRRTTYDNGTGERTEWHRLKLWDRLAQLAEEYIRKGDRLYAEGRIDYGSYERQDGETVYTTEIVVNELIMLGASGGYATDDGEDDMHDRARKPPRNRRDEEYRKTTKPRAAKPSRATKRYAPPRRDA